MSTLAPSSTALSVGERFLSSSVVVLCSVYEQLLVFCLRGRERKEEGEREEERERWRRGEVGERKGDISRE